MRKIKVLCKKEYILYISPPKASTLVLSTNTSILALIFRQQTILLLYRIALYLILMRRFFKLFLHYMYLLFFIRSYSRISSEISLILILQYLGVIFRQQVILLSSENVLNRILVRRFFSEFQGFLLI